MTIVVADTELKWANVTSKCCYQSIAELCTRQMICVCVLHVQLRMPVHRSQHKKGFGRLGMRKFCPSETIFGTCVLKTGKGGLSWGCTLLPVEHPSSNSSFVEMGSAVWLEKARGPFSSGPTALRWVWRQSETCLLYRSGKLAEVQDIGFTWHKEAVATDER